MASEIKEKNEDIDLFQDILNNQETVSQNDTSDRKDDDEEEEEEEEEDKIVEKSHNSRFHKRNKRFPKQIDGVDNAFVAIEPKSGKEVIWNECILSEKKTDKENRYLSLIKKLKKHSHPFLVRFLDAWVSKYEDGPRKLVFITERLDDCTLKQFLCNSAKNNRLWKRHTGQLLSVLMYLHRLGVSHGNLTKEAIYYQNSGNLKIGPFSLSGILDQKSQAEDIYSLGVVALEIAVWTPTDFQQNLTLPERCQQMISRLENEDQKGFIDICLDSNLTPEYKMRHLVNHSAITEVPVLKLLSAKVIVSSIISMSNEEGTSSDQAGFASLLKDYLSHYEDETVIVEVHFPQDNLTKSRSWKDFRSNFTLTSKYLEDVRNGFYPLFGCRWIWDKEDETALGSVTSNTPYPPPTNGTALPATQAAGTITSRSELPSVPGQTCSSGTSTAPSTCVSRKHSNAAKSADIIPIHSSQTVSAAATTAVATTSVITTTAATTSATTTVISATTKQETTIIDSSNKVAQVTGRSDSSSGIMQPNNIHVPPEIAAQTHESGMSPSVTKEDSKTLNKAESAMTVSRQDMKCEKGANRPTSDRTLLGQTESQSASKNIEAARPSNTEVKDIVYHFPDRGLTVLIGKSEGIVSGRHIGSDGKLSFDSSAEASDIAHVPGQPGVQVSESSVPNALSHRSTPVRDGQEVSSVPGCPPISKSQSFDQNTKSPANVANERLSDAGNIRPRDKTDKNEDQEPDEVDEDEKDDEDDDDDDNEEDDDDDDDDEKGVIEAIERYEPQTIHVQAPDRAPSQAALFTHCQYFYIGAGRWQVYVQMWFVEDRLKRETYVQVFDYEWHDYERVADLFEASRCFNPTDRPTLIRLLALARHNCALVDGELQFPGPLTGNFDTLELHEKLSALHLHQQARELLANELTKQESGTSSQNAYRSPTASPIVGLERKDNAVQENLTTDCILSAKSKPIECYSEINPPAELSVCSEHIVQAQNQFKDVTTMDPPSPSQASSFPPDLDTQKEVASLGRPTTKPADSATTLFLDVGSLAPRNAYCALCDKHDYLHNINLPAYLISPCYHCREFLAREAKISPEILLDLHLKHNIPWPAFLQARFNIPNDGRSPEELIAYDCRWRSRQPCRCFTGSGGSLLPPCVEFPWLYPPPSTVAWEKSTAASANQVTTDSKKDSNVQNPADPATLMTTSSTSDELHNVGSTHLDSKNVSPAPGQGGHESTSSTNPSTTHPQASSHSVQRPQLPCAGRHSRGAPMTCCHGIHFPSVSLPTSGSSHPVLTTSHPAHASDPQPTISDLTSTVPDASLTIPVSTTATTVSPGAVPNPSPSLINGTV